MSKRKKNRPENNHVAGDLALADSNQPPKRIPAPARPFRHNSIFLLLSSILLAIWIVFLAVLVWKV